MSLYFLHHEVFVMAVYRFFGVEVSPKRSDTVFDSVSKEKTGFSVGLERGFQTGTFAPSMADFCKGFGIHEFSAEVEEFRNKIRLGDYLAYDFLSDFMYGFLQGVERHQSLEAAGNAFSIASSEACHRIGDIFIQLEGNPEGVSDFEFRTKIGDKAVSGKQLLEIGLYIHKGKLSILEDAAAEEPKFLELILDKSTLSFDSAAGLCQFLRQIMLLLCEEIEQHMFEEYVESNVNKLLQKINSMQPWSHERIPNIYMEPGK